MCGLLPWAQIIICSHFIRFRSMPLKLQDLRELYWLWSPCSVLFQNFIINKYLTSYIQNTGNLSVQCLLLLLLLFFVFCCCTILTKIRTFQWDPQQKIPNFRFQVNSLCNFWPLIYLQTKRRWINRHIFATFHLEVPKYSYLRNEN
jgi:hypothetical protein